MSAQLVSDQEREYTVGLLRRHWLTGRLTSEEFEQRVGEAWQARSVSDLWEALRLLPVEGPPPARRASSATAVCSLVVGLVGLMLTPLFLLSLPISISAWALGRNARRSGSCSVPGVAIAGEVLGITGAGLSLMMLAACAALLA